MLVRVELDSVLSTLKKILFQPGILTLQEHDLSLKLRVRFELLIFSVQNLKIF